MRGFQTVAKLKNRDSNAASNDDLFLSLALFSRLIEDIIDIFSWGKQVGDNDKLASFPSSYASCGFSPC